MTNEPESRDAAGRALYEERTKILPGLAQPPAPVWGDLEEPVRERWRGYAEASAAGTGPARSAQNEGEASSPSRSTR